jgi:hypothetical protein
MIADSRRAIPLVWTVSKIEDSTPFGLTELKFTQETYSPQRDNKELMICDYYAQTIIPENLDPASDLLSPVAITYNGTQPTIKVGGSWKVFTSIFKDIGVTLQKWTISDDNGAITEEMEDYIIEYDDDKLKLKIARNYELIGKVLIVQAIGTDNVTGEVRIEVIG